MNYYDDERAKDLVFALLIGFVGTAALAWLVMLVTVCELNFFVFLVWMFGGFAMQLYCVLKVLKEGL